MSSDLQDIFLEESETSTLGVQYDVYEFLTYIVQMRSYDEPGTRALALKMLDAFEETTGSYEDSFDSSLLVAVNTIVTICVLFLCVLLCLYFIYYRSRINRILNMLLNTIRMQRFFPAAYFIRAKSTDRNPLLSSK
jgi:hypothetical protein